jgi:hypothetical protein
MYLTMIKIKKTSNNERGFASIVVALTLIIILALISVGFAQLARREQQNSLDKQLANQAFYAAESGVNDVVKGIQNGTITEGLLNSIGYNNNNCLSSTSTPSISSIGLNNIIDPSNDTTYPCVILNLTPPDLNYALKPGESRSATFTPDFSPNPQPVAPTTIDLTITWGSGDNPPQTKYISNPNRGDFSPSNVWNSPPGQPPLLQFSITSLNSTPNRASLINSTFAAYLSPSTSNSNNSTAYSAATVPQQVPILGGDCSNGVPGRLEPCVAKITGILYNPGDSYLLHFLDLYDASNIYVNGNAVSSSLPINFANSQDIVDVTGKAQNVLKRVQVRLTPIQPNQAPSNAIQATDICKHFATGPTSIYNPLGTSFLDANGSNASAADPCNLDF